MRNYNLCSLCCVLRASAAARGERAGRHAGSDDGRMVMGQDMMSACPTPSNLPETVNIGAIFALSGAVSVYGRSQQQAVNLAVQQINDSGLSGRQHDTRRPVRGLDGRPPSRRSTP